MSSDGIVHGMSAWRGRARRAESQPQPDWFVVGDDDSRRVLSTIASHADTPAR